MTNPFAKSLGIPDDTVWDWIHVYKACLLEEILRGRGAAGEYRELICFTRNEYRDEYYQQMGWMWFGVSTFTLDEVDDLHQTFFAHPVRSINLDDRNCDSSLANSPKDEREAPRFIGGEERGGDFSARRVPRPARLTAIVRL